MMKQIKTILKQIFYRYHEKNYPSKCQLKKSSVNTKTENKFLEDYYLLKVRIGLNKFKVNKLGIPSTSLEVVTVI